MTNTHFWDIVQENRIIAPVQEAAEEQVHAYSQKVPLELFSMRNSR